MSEITGLQTNEVDLNRVSQNPFEADSNRVSQNPIWKDLLFLLIKIMSIVLVFILLFTFVFGLMRYQDPSMAPAVKDGDLVVFYRHSAGGYKPGDALVFKTDKQKHISRIIATGGDMVDITEDGLVINESLQQEPEIFQETMLYAEGVSFPLTVPEGQVFVLGDNRISATDSRIYGCVKPEDSLGKVMSLIRMRNI